MRNNKGLRKVWICYLEDGLDESLALGVREKERVMIRMVLKFLTSAAQGKVIASQQRLINPRTLTWCGKMLTIE